MQLRTSRVLKLFAILLFSLESLAPSVFSIAYASEVLVADNQAQKSFFNHTASISIFAEECDGEERNDGSHEIGIATHAVVVAFPKFQKSEQSNFSPHPVDDRFTCSTPLFQLHCLYLI